VTLKETLKKNLNVPNVLSLIRLLLVPVYLILFVRGQKTAALIVFAAACFTDLLDGRIARKYNLITDLGKLLDPVADKVMILTAMFSMTIGNDAIHAVIPWAAVLVVLAKELMMTQRAVKAPEMKELGLCNHVYPKEQLMDEAMKLANKIAKGPLNCYSSSKLILNKSFETNLEDLLKEETEAQAAARLHPNGDEGLAAFLEKRKANFQ
jgi:hypothetical protein